MKKDKKDKMSLQLKGTLFLCLVGGDTFQSQKTAYLLLLNFTHKLVEVKSLNSCCSFNLSSYISGAFFKMLMNDSDSLNSDISLWVLIYLLFLSPHHYSRIPNFPPLPSRSLLLLLVSPLSVSTPVALLSVCDLLLSTTNIHSLLHRHRGEVSGEARSLCDSYWPLVPADPTRGRNEPGSWVEYLWGESSFLWPCHHLILKVRVSNGYGVYGWAYGQRRTHSIHVTAMSWGGRGCGGHSAEEQGEINAYFFYL